MRVGYVCAWTLYTYIRPEGIPHGRFRHTNTHTCACDEPAKCKHVFGRDQRDMLFGYPLAKAVKYENINVYTNAHSGAFDVMRTPPGVS